MGRRTSLPIPSEWNPRFASAGPALPFSSPLAATRLLRASVSPSALACLPRVACIKLLMLAAHPEVDVWPLLDLLLLLVLEAGAQRTVLGVGWSPGASASSLTRFPRSVETARLKGIIAAEDHGNHRGHLESFLAKSRGGNRARIVSFNTEFRKNKPEIVLLLSLSEENRVILSPLFCYLHFLAVLPWTFFC